jgi:uncharacterized 2Fe-2S/4Fe-4S cluster protein (DUF4445 family)
MKETILDYLRNHNTPIQASCSGMGLCGNCKVKTKPAIKLVKLEERVLSRSEIDSGVRLACMHEMDDCLSIKVVKQGHMQITSDFSTTYAKTPYLQLQPNQQGFDVYSHSSKVGHVDKQRLFGVAVDIGTTTVVVALVNVVSKRVVSVDAFQNAQTAYGSDVISRIQYASTKEGLNHLSDLIKRDIHESIQSLIKQQDADLSYLYEVVLSGNATMIHIILKEAPNRLAQAPFVSSIQKTVSKSYKDLFEADCPAQVTLLGDADAYVGGDIMSGIFSTNSYKDNQYTLFLDLGTNGEMALIHSNSILATSVAAGPAFEGVNISCGMGATEGAITSFNGLQKYTTIRNKKPRGICGSGLIDVMAYLRRTHIIDASGRMKKQFSITDHIYISQKDVREFQLARAAVRTGVDKLIQESGVSEDNIKRVIISGGFGAYINLDHFFELQVLPVSFKERTHSVGNSSLSGAVKYLLTSTKDVELIIKKTHVINLSHLASFQDTFVRYIPFED